MNPIILDDDTPIGAYEIKPEPKKEEAKPGFAETFNASIRYDNEVYNVYQGVDNSLRTFGELLTPSESEFNPLEDQYLEMVSPEHWGNLSTAKTRGELFRKVERINQETHDKGIQAQGSTWATLAAGAVNGITSPTMLFPIANGIKSVNFLAGYQSWFKNVLPSLAGGFAVSEANLVFSQETRTVKEAALNTAVASTMGAILGGAGTAFRSLKFKAYKDIIQSGMEGLNVKFNVTDAGELKGFSAIDDSVGAQSVREVNLAGESLYGWGENGEIKIAKPFLWTTAKLLQNPVLKGVTSKSATVRKFTNDMLEHNFEVAKSAVNGEFSQEALQTAIWTRQATAFNNELKLSDAYYEYLGIDPKDNFLVKKAKGALKDKKDLLSYDKFLSEVYLATTKGGLSDIPVAARESKRIIDTIMNPMYDELVDFKILPPNLTPFGATQHVMRMYDKEAIVASKPQKMSFLVSKFSETNEKINQVMQPVDSLRAKVANLKEDLASVTNESQIAVLKAELNRSQKKLLTAEKKVKESILDGKYSPDMLTGDRGMDLKEIKQLKTLRKPIRDAQKRINSLERELQVYTKKRNPNRLPGQKNVPVDKKQKALQKQILEEQKKLKAYRQEIGQKIDAGTIDAKLAFRNKQGNWRLKKTNPGSLRLRKILDHSELTEAAENTLNNILGLSEEQLHSELLGMFKSGSNGTNPLMPRTLLISDEDLVKQGFLNTDIRKNVSAYTLRMARLIEMEKYARNQGYTGDGPKLEFLSNGIKNDYRALTNSLEKDFRSKSEGKTGKALEKLEKEVKKERLSLRDEEKNDIELAASIYKRIMGQYEIKNGPFIKSMRLLKQWAYSTQLGALFLVCMQDAVAPIFRQGFVPYVKYGVKPFLTNTLKLSKNNARLRESCRDMAIGIETLQAFNSQKFDLNQEIFTPMNFVERALDGTSRAMGVLNMSGPWSDAFQYIAATSSQSRLIRDLRAFKDGSINKTYLRELQNLRLDPKVWGDRILAQMEKHGEELSGAYLPNWHLWDDSEAKRIFQGAIRKEVRATNFSGSDIASFPIGIDPGSPSSSLLMYMGWSFNATANYLLPMLQKMDVNKATGIALMMAVSSLVDPLREIADGKEPDMDPSRMFKKALLNSGVLGLYGDIFNRVNAIGNIFPGAQVDRYRHTRGMISFAPEGLVTDFLNVVGAGINNEWNKKDIKRLQRMIPLTSLIYFRQFTNDLIDSLGVPDTRAQAEKISNWR